MIRAFMWSLVFVLGGVRIARAEQPEWSYADHAALTVDVSSVEALEALEGAGAVILNCVPGAGPMDVLLPTERMDLLEEFDLAYEIRAASAATLLARRPVAARTGDPYLDFFDDYREYGSAAESGTIVWYLHELAARYPDLASVFSLGNTYEGRTIWGLRVVSPVAPASRPAVFYYGAQHAREWIATTVPTFFASALLEGYGSDPQTTELVDAVEFYLVPVVNVDGYLFTWPSGDRAWRKNRRLNANGTYGVDLNRNWAEKWGGVGASAFPAKETYHGTAPFSEPETQALRDFFLNHPHIRAQLDIHSFSQMVLFPYGYTDRPVGDFDDYLRTGTTMQNLIRAVYGTGYQTGPVNTTIYPASGISVDWVHEALGVYSFSFECRDRGQFGMLLPPDQIIPNGEELVPAMLHLADTDRVRLPVRFSFPNGLPKTLPVGGDTTIAVELIDQYEQAQPATAQLHYRYDAAGSFTSVPLVEVGSNAYEATLPAADCSATPEFYFSVVGDAGTVARSPREAPGETHRAAVATGNEVFFFEDLSSDPGWNTEGLWAWGRPRGLGSHGGDPLNGYTGDHVYGYNLDGGFGVQSVGQPRTARARRSIPFTPAPPLLDEDDLGDYRNNTPARYLTTPSIDCTGRANVRLSYYRWLGVESNSGFDEASIEIQVDGGPWTVVWQASETGQAVVDYAWYHHELDLSAYADGQADVRLRWGMGPTDQFVTYFGWNIDDIALTSAVCEELESPRRPLRRAGRGATVESRRAVRTPATDAPSP